MNNTWFSLWWTMWANNCDILKPLFERDNDKLAAAKFEPAVTEPCHREIVEFWWDAINTHKISPPGMTAYGRNEANAIFMAGEAAFTLVDFNAFRRIQRSQAFEDRRQSRHGALPGRAARTEAYLLERDLGLGDPEGSARRAQASSRRKCFLR